MCLDAVDTKIKIPKSTTVKNGLLPVYKACCQTSKRWKPEFNGREFKAGVNTSPRKRAIINDWTEVRYVPGFHAFFHKRDADDWTGDFLTVIKCYVHKDWILHTGKQRGRACVSRHIIMPKHPDKKLTHKQALEIYREWKKETK